ncbi:MAG: transglutaminase-like domain-containing protein [Paludibacter sp.]|nr:transglutaminase-like domain-containing protein [Paludibacter sp.]
MKQKQILLFIIFILYHSSLFGHTYFSETDKKIKLISDKASYNVSEIAKFINFNFRSEPEKIRAIYTWIANNIHYDIERKHIIRYYDNYEQLNDLALKTRKGVCMSYSTLFL